MKTIPLTESLPYVYSGDDTELYTQLVLTPYNSNGSLALVLLPESQDPHAEVILTTNLETPLPGPEYVTINVNSSVVTDLYPKLVETGLLEETDLPNIQSGWVTYPVYRLTDTDAVAEMYTEFNQLHRH